MDGAQLTSMALVCALCAHHALHWWLNLRHARHVAHHRSQVPAAFASTVALAAHQKAADYTLARLRVAQWELVVASGLTLGWTLMGGLQALDHWLLQALGSGLLQQTALLALFGAVGSVVDAIFGAYRTFSIEQRFGFNASSVGLWLADMAKALLLSALLGIPLLALLLWAMQNAGSTWWIYGWLGWMGVNLLLLWVFPTWIAPWFNQFRALDDTTLSAQVHALLQRNGLQAQGCYVMDGSRRSTHANAYFTGMGQAKRVVFYDTLLQKLTPPQTLAVLAHEIGHFRLHHIGKRLVWMASLTLAGFFVLNGLMTTPAFYIGMGVQPPTDRQHQGLALALFMVWLPLVATLLTPLSAWGSRQHEFQADQFAVQEAGSDALAGALIQLQQDNCATLTPDPWYVAFHYAHPAPSERLARLR